MRPDELSIPQRLLLAAHRLSAGGPFSESALAVAAWEDSPAVFGLPGYEAAHPDRNKVCAALSGGKGLVGRKKLARADGRLALTPAGMAEALRLLSELPAPAGKPPPARRPPRLAPEAESLLRRVLASGAWAKWRERRPDDITFPEACDLWRGDPDALTEAVYRAGERFPEGVTLADGLCVPVLDLAKVIDMSGWLRERHAKALRLLAGRNGGQRP